MDIKDQYNQLESQLKPLIPVIGKAADTILDEDVSKYPIFAVFKNELAIGLPLIERAAPAWSVNASTLEEFATKNLIGPDKVENFQEIYKDPTNFVCLFVVDNGGATFIFLPR